MAAITEELVGKVFNRLTIIKILNFRKEKRSTFVLCKCECGTQKELSYQLVKSNKTKSCGCLRAETSKKHLTGQTWSRKEKGSGGLNRVFMTIKNNAKQRNLSFTLTKAEVKFYTSKNCSYCDKSPKTLATTSPKAMTIEGLKHSEYLYNGLDRVNNNLGYELNNIVACCGLCNWMKKDLSKKDFIFHIKTIYETLKLGEVDASY